MTRYTTTINSPVVIPTAVLNEAIERAVKKLTKQYEPPKLVVRTHRHPEGAAGGYTSPKIRTIPYPDTRPPYYITMSEAALENLVNGAARARAALTTPDETKKSQSRSHPFEGPEVNDDLPLTKVEKAVLAATSLTEAERAAVQTIGADFPRIQELIEAKRPKRPKATEPPAAEGDWQLPEDDGKVGTD